MPHLSLRDGATRRDDASIASSGCATSLTMPAPRTSTYGPEPRSASDRFWDRVNKDGPVVRPELGPCWVWTASTSDRGYGQIDIRPGGRKRTISAHRLSWELHNGAPGGLHVLHRCDNPPCVRPEHLFLGTHAENLRDMALKGRQPNRILSAADVAQIRSLRQAGMPIRALAKRFAVALSTVSMIVTHRSWRHVT